MISRRINTSCFIAKLRDLMAVRPSTTHNSLCRLTKKCTVFTQTSHYVPNSLNANGNNEAVNTSESRLTITIDGPSASGKSTVAQEVARQLGIFYLNTGLLYRCLTYGLFFALPEYKGSIGLDLSDNKTIIDKLNSIDINTISYFYGANKDDNKKYSSLVYFRGVDVTSKCYTTDKIDQLASKISTVPEVRAFLLDYQREFARRNDIVVDGRDCGSVVFPEPSVNKFYLTASAEVRAMRRLNDNKSLQSNSKSLDEMIADIESRDQRDMNRSISPLCVPSGAMVIDSSHLTMEQVVRLIIESATKKC